MKAFIYARQSSGDDDVSESVEQQIANCKILAQKEHIEVVGVYSDLNTSGKTYPTGAESISSIDLVYQNWIKESSLRKYYRKGLGDLLVLIKNVDFIIVDDYTRLARPITGSFLESYISQILTVNSIKVWTVKNGIVDQNKFSDSLLTTLQNYINHNQLSIQRQKAKDAIKTLKNRGEYYGSLNTLFGYKKINKDYFIDEERAEVVRVIYDEYLKFTSIHKIQQLVVGKYKHLFKSPVGACRGFIARCLDKVIYTGYQYDCNSNLVKSKQLEGKAIISFDTWKKVQEIRKNNKIIPQRVKKSWLPLSGKIICGYCEYRMVVSHKNKTQRVYCCANTNITENVDCKKNRILNSFYKQSFGVGLMEFVRPLLILGYIKSLEEHLNKNKIMEDVNAKKVELENLITKEKTLTEVYMNGLLDSSVYKEKLSTIKNNKNELQQYIIQHSISEDIEYSQEYIENKFNSVVKLVNGDVENFEFVALANEIVNKIVVFKDYVEFFTIYGMFKIERLKIGNHNLMPNYTINWEMKTNSNIDKLFDTINLILYYDKNQEICKNGNMERLPYDGKLLWNCKNFNIKIGKLKDL